MRPASPQAYSISTHSGTLGAQTTSRSPGAKTRRQRLRQPLAVGQQFRIGPAARRLAVEVHLDQRRAVAAPVRHLAQRAADRRLQHRIVGLGGNVGFGKVEAVHFGRSPTKELNDSSAASASSSREIGCPDLALQPGSQQPARFFQIVVGLQTEPKTL